MASEVWIRQLAELEATRRGWLLVRVGWYDHRTRRSHDLLQAFDMLCAHGGQTFAIQYTSRGNHAARRRKLQANAEALTFAREANWRIELWSFDPKGQIKVEDIA